MTTLKNGTNKCIRCCTRINGRWFDGLLPGETLECDEPNKVRALLKHGCIEISSLAVNEHPTVDGPSETDLAQENVNSKRKRRKRRAKREVL